MEKVKKRRRRMAVLIVFAAILVWVGGCATGQSMGLSALVSMEDKETAVEGDSVVGGVVEGNTNGSDADEIPKDSNKDQGTDEQTKNDGSNPYKGDPDEDISEETLNPDHNEKRVALTFDDGPDTRYTTAILDILKEKGVKATFFVVGTQVERHPDILQRMVDEGHEIGNHTQTHKDLRTLSKSQIISEISETDNAIEEVLGFTPSIFRAPYGALSKKVMNVLHEHDRRHVGWTVDTRDWAGTSVSDMRDMIRNETKPNGIILMHSFGGKHIINTVNMLSGAIDDLAEKGFTFVTIDQIPE
ncbi:polysaccharide deacetylase family protein [Paenibacillus sp. GSMTC-2017]|uniref:polysaccharide deacetylase family protein n=1 Tax=Paenibacillus sp. GSMTC-2017 TaxID=2794350 RepID=UPI0018D66469|nr:polysaccharide deacetylase family protein [Paenibacillus sp. GSMTC-2017]MBH5319009.1 polysaccharide deacetylase family protein [Paenibacillus sp. GSMTC-2017]